MTTLVMVVAACDPSIAPGSYLCGANQACPPDQVCDGVTDSCTLKGQEMPFTCAMGTEVAGDDDAAHAQQIPQLNCVSAPFAAEGCMPGGDAQDWLKFSVPSVCSAGNVEVEIRLSFPVAYEKLALELWSFRTNAPIGTDVPCVQSANDPAHIDRCITLMVNPGEDYGVVVKATTDGNCGGSCSYNRYELSVQLATPG